MEIARLEVSTQQHLDRMQETAKVNYVQYGKSTKNKKGKKSTQSGTRVGAATGVTKAMELVLNPVERVRSFHSRKTLATDVEKADTRKYRIVSCGCSVQRLWKEGAFQEGLSQETFHTFTRGSIGFHHHCRGRGR